MVIWWIQKHLSVGTTVWSHIYTRDAVGNKVPIYCDMTPNSILLLTYTILLVYKPRWGLNTVHEVDEWKTNLMSLAILFHLLCAQHVSDINIPIFRSPRLCWWITTSVVLFSVRCVLQLLLRLVFGGVRCEGFSLQNEHHQISAATKAPTHNELRTRRPMW